MTTLTVFDLDDTLIDGDTSVKWRHFLTERGVITDPDYAKRDQAMMRQYVDGTLDLSAYLTFSLTPIANISIATIDEWVQEFIENHVLSHVFTQAKTTLAELRQDNLEEVIVISATVAFLVKPIAHALGIKHAIGVDLAVDNDHYVSQVIGTASFREGKVTRLKEWLTERGREIDDYDNVVFYTDSINDLPLCEFASEVITVNPCPKLRPIAIERGWQVVHWHR